MTLTQLSYIVAVDKHRHFATAAKKIYITQPTLSMQIQKLEDELGVLIFDRSKSPVVPTAIGEEIITQAKQILSGAKHIEDMVSVQGETLKGSFRIGIIPTIAPYLVPLFLKPFVDKHPEVELVFEEALTEEVLKGLNEDYFDVGIIATPTEQHIFEHELFLEPFLAYMNPNHELTKKDKIAIEDMYEEDLWLLNEGHCFRDQTMKICKKNNEKRNKTPITFESGNLETLKRLVEQDFGVTLMPYLAMNDHDTRCANGVVKKFSDPVPSRKIRLVYSREFLKKNLIDSFADVIKNSIPEELESEEEKMVIE
ncbi:hydrogen peroxide-inducible genes activator [Gracilimonas mengyeensis]|uniref:LysR family transcriptional regulator, hydrogen peroxide-inducible genes activator n=1 Tax=Gracilimonas mengyeensis TaxID=1302730 RepID=A0A521AC23_9BACT|nr:hydrogen peroxide-inducible genes activator [Gracilimonas mengyeensis]SMO32373.1 LysR family transcriptional regulator, hydrogen peroxide-inducible genes activator [Gracilimonas mengyeensis]